MSHDMIYESIWRDMDDDVRNGTNQPLTPRQYLAWILWSSAMMVNRDQCEEHLLVNVANSVCQYEQGILSICRERPRDRGIRIFLVDPRIRYLDNANDGLPRPIAEGYIQSILDEFRSHCQACYATLVLTMTKFRPDGTPSYNHVTPAFWTGVARYELEWRVRATHEIEGIPLENFPENDEVNL